MPALILRQAAQPVSPHLSPMLAPKIRLEFMKSFWKSRSRNRRPRRNLSYGKFEPRTMLAGDVFVAVQDSILLIVGDGQANQVEVSTNSDGSVNVEGVNTTINGSNGSVSIPADFMHLTVSLGGGNDSFDINGVLVPHHFSIYGGAGNDQLMIESVDSQLMHLEGGAGDDVFGIANSSSLQSSYVYLDAGDDTLAVDSMESRRNFRVFGHDGNDLITTNALSVSRKLDVNTDNGADQVLMSGSTTAGNRARVNTGNGNDFLGVMSPINGLVANGGADADQIEPATGTNGFNFETIGVANLQATLDGVFERLTDSGIDATPFGGSTDNGGGTEQTELALTVASSALDYVENDAAKLVDGNLAVAGDVEIVSATVQIADFVQGSESLSFTNVSGINGSFDQAQGTLTFTGGATAADYQAILRSVRYENTSDNFDAATRFVSITLVNADADSVTDQRTISYLAVDDALSLTLPSPFDGDQAVDATVDEALTFTANGLDLDNTVTYSLDLTQSGIDSGDNQPTIDASSGEFSWTPSTAGDFTITVAATNDLGGAVNRTFDVTVTETQGFIETGDVTVTSGSALPDYDSANDTGVGQTLGEFTALTNTGQTVSIENGTTGRVFAMVAHWCPHCQNELPELVDWLNTTTLPSDVEFQLISVGVDDTRGNFPASDWLKDEQYPGTVLVDDTSSTLQDLFGLTAYPFWVAVDSSGTVTQRLSGPLTTAQLDQLVASASSQ